MQRAPQRTNHPGSQRPWGGRRAWRTRREPVSSLPDLGPAGRVVVAGEQVILRAGLASLLGGSGYEVVGEAADADTLVAVTRQTLPDLVIVDVEMFRSRRAGQPDAASSIRQELPDTKVLVLSAEVDGDDVMQLLEQADGVGYLLRDGITDVEEFVSAVGHMVMGGSVIDPAVARALHERRNRARHPLVRLSEREREVLDLVAEGRSNAGIAHQLFVTVGTVENHLNSAYAKLGISADPADHRRVLAARMVLQAG